MKWSVVAPAEVAQMLGGLSRQRVYQLTNEPGFPAPLQKLATGNVWSYDDVCAWAKLVGREVHPIGDR